MTAPASGVSCIVLAAGNSSRFGTDKRAARLNDGRPLLDATLASIPLLFEQRILVLHPGDEALAAAHASNWHTLIVPTAAQGMGHSLAAGLAAAAGDTGVLIVLADMPAVRASTYAGLANLLHRDRLVLPRHMGQRGNPVGIGRDFFAELAMPEGDHGARRLLQTHADAIHWFDCDDSGILKDVDKPEDLDR